MSTNPFVRLYYWLIDTLNAIFPPRPTDALIQETIESQNKATAQSLEAIKQSNGNIQVLMNQLGLNQSGLNASKIMRDRLTQQYQQKADKPGPELEAIKRQLVYAQQIVESKQRVVDEITQAISAVKITQESAEAGLVISQSEADAKIATMKADAALERLYGVMENVSDAQLRAAGILKSPEFKDHSAEIADRRATKQGRAEAVQRVAQNMVGTATNKPLSIDQEDLLSRALANADTKSAPITETQKDKRTNKVGS